jgi:hypothetical protein
MKKIITGLVAMVLMFSLTTQFTANAAQIENETNDTLSDLFTGVLELGSDFDNTIGLNGDYIAIDTTLATKQGATNSEIKQAKSKVKEHNQITEDTLALQPFVTNDEKGFYLDEESARTANVSEDLIEATIKDFELMNSIEPLATCNGRSSFTKTSDGFYSYFDSCETAKIINYIQIGAAIATLALAVASFIAPPVGLATIIAVGLFDVGAISLGFANIANCGIWIKWTGTTNPDPGWAHNQC